MIAALAADPGMADDLIQVVHTLTRAAELVRAARVASPA